MLYVFGVLCVDKYLYLILNNNILNYDGVTTQYNLHVDCAMTI